MTPSIQLDTRLFEAALREYFLVKKKDLAYVVNRQALSVAIKASQETPLALRFNTTSDYVTVRWLRQNPSKSVPHCESGEADAE